MGATLGMGIMMSFCTTITMQLRTKIRMHLRHLTMVFGSNAINGIIMRIIPQENSMILKRYRIKSIMMVPVLIFWHNEIFAFR